MKVVYLAQGINMSGEKDIRDWKAALTLFTISYADRLPRLLGSKVMRPKRSWYISRRRSTRGVAGGSTALPRVLAELRLFRHGLTLSRKSAESEVEHQRPFPSTPRYAEKNLVTSLALCCRQYCIAVLDLAGEDPASAGAADALSANRIDRETLAFENIHDALANFNPQLPAAACQLDGERCVRVRRAGRAEVLGRNCARRPARPCGDRLDTLHEARRPTQKDLITCLVWAERTRELTVLKSFAVVAMQLDTRCKRKALNSLAEGDMSRSTRKDV